MPDGPEERERRSGVESAERTGRGFDVRREQFRRVGSACIVDESPGRFDRAEDGDTNCGDGKADDRF